MAYVQPGAGKVVCRWRKASGSGTTVSNLMYTLVNVLGGDTQTIEDQETGSDVTVTTANAVSDLNNFMSKLVSYCTTGDYDEGRVKYEARIFASGDGAKAIRYQGDDIEPEEIETPKSEGEDVINLKGGDK